MRSRVREQHPRSRRKNPLNRARLDQAPNRGGKKRNGAPQGNRSPRKRRRMKRPSPVTEHPREARVDLPPNDLRSGLGVAASPVQWDDRWVWIGIGSRQVVHAETSCPPYLCFCVLSKLTRPPISIIWGCGFPGSPLATASGLNLNSRREFSRPSMTTLSIHMSFRLRERRHRCQTGIPDIPK